ncbi:hypothetical protein [Prauserella rugosa]|uniref:Uncharacterized protein n=1 Tax=Prauserella rugosa TaxID=43354 RepID=A0A660CDY5_9PSEU|nr:hypothetical protein [Prauserella rugosa]TWH21602.1 hypothetical protein JD82_03468 [Prauserella rugosa]
MTLRRLLSGDTPTLLALFVGGWLISAFYRIEWWRGVLGAGEGSPAPVVVFVGVTAVAVWSSLMRRRFLWAEPAALTWRDFIRAHDRVHAISGRVWFGWLARLAGLAYLGAFVGAVWRVPEWSWAVMACVVAVGGLVALPLAAGVGVPWRLPVAARATRERLVDGWRERVVRTVGVTFLDPGMVMPPGRAVRMRVRSARSFVVAGVLARARYLPAAAILAVVAAAMRPVLPAVPDAALVGVCAYAALVPFGGGAGWLWRSPGLRRWLHERDVVLRAWNLAAVAMLAAVWGAMLAVAGLVVGGVVPMTVWPVLAVVVASVVRTATRPPVDYSTPAATDTPFGQAPVHLVGQLLRGPDLVLIGVLAALALPTAATACVAVALAAWSVLR